MSINYANFSLLGGVGSAPTQHQTTAPVQDTARTQLLTGVASQVAVAAIAAHSSARLDRIRTRVEQDRIDHERTMLRIGRDQAAWRGAIRMKQLREAQIQESLSLQVQEMQTRAKLQTEMGQNTGPTFDRLQRIVAQEFKEARFKDESAQVAQRAALWGEMVSQGFVGARPVAERGTSGVEQVGNFLVDSIRIGRDAFGRG